MTGYLVLENGEIFEGKKIGYDKDNTICEVVFNTSMVGYIETFTDPSYSGQGICMTYPLIGNYGVILEDKESTKIYAKAVFVHEIAKIDSNFRKDISLNDFLIQNKTPGLANINTRKLTKILRNHGTMRGMITSDIFNLDSILEQIKNYKSPNFVEEVSTKEIFSIGEGKINIALIDFGAKQNIINSLLKRDSKITVFPQDITHQKIIDGNFDGIMLSNGPGNPEDCKEAIENIKELYKTDIPIFGICLGHQLMAIATGAKTAKLKYGHRGPNHPVKDIKKDRVYITSQNHGYYVLEESINPEIAKVSHVSLNDGTVEGLIYNNKKIFTVQFHPEACPGPQDTSYLFDEFIDMIKKSR